MDSRLSAANLILERGVRFRLPAPFWKRLLKRNFVTIHHLKAGTIIEIAKVVIENKLEDLIGVSDYEFLKKSIPACAKCIAIAVLNDKTAIERKAEKLTRKLISNVEVESLVKLFIHVTSMNRVSDFMTITRYLSMMTQTMMNPRALGQKSGS